MASPPRTPRDAQAADRPARTETVEDLVTHALYRIATGVWGEGARLPSVREAERRWGVDRRRVLAAYGRLEELGLVVRRPRSGFRVAQGPRPGRLARHRGDLERLYERFAAELARETGLEPLGAFRWLAQLAAIRAHERPPVAFVECTAAQAQAHAEEVFLRLGLPCLALRLGELVASGPALPASLRTLLVSGFHLAEVRALQSAGGLGDRDVVGVPIELDPAVASVSERHATLLLDRDPAEAAEIAADLQRLGFRAPLRAEGAPDPGAFLERLLAPGAGERRTLVLLAPRLWGELAPRWRAHPQVAQAAFRVRADAWPAVADALGLPLGDPAGSARG